MLDVPIPSFACSGEASRAGGSVPASLLFGLAALVVIGLVLTTPIVLLYRSPSEPPGFYILTARAPSRGEIIAFTTPAPAFPCAAARIGYLHHPPLLTTAPAVAPAPVGP